MRRKYSDAWDALSHLLQSGRSFSGHERNCCFLNLGNMPGAGAQFADASATSGFDFPDDARGLALVDWDQDGDLDVWTSNRTGPTVRFLRNNLDQEANYLSIKLEGRSGNRDAIGARISVHLSGDDETGSPLTRTLRAGSAYLSQSSKWLHFGLEPQSVVARCVVRWPNGQEEDFSGIDLQTSRRYVLRQSTSVAVSWTTSARSLAVSPTPSPEPPTNAAAVRLFSRPLMPKINYQDFTGQTMALDKSVGQPMLVSLWATWCSPCIREFTEWSNHEREIRDAGLQIIALSVDQLGTAAASDEAVQPQEVLQKIDFPYVSGWATTELVQQFDLVQKAVLQRDRPLPLPVNFLLDAEGRLAILYKGPVGLQRLVTDVKSLNIRPDASRQLALPFAGRWLHPPAPTSMSRRTVRQLGEMGQVELAIRYARRLERQSQQSTVANDPPAALDRTELANVFATLADTLRERDHLDKALENYRHALTYDTNHKRCHLALGEMLAQAGNLDDAARYFERALDNHPNDPEVLSNLGVMRMRKGQVQEARLLFEQALQARAGDPDILKNLATANLRQGKIDDAASQLESVLHMRPDDPGALYNMAYIRMAQQRPADAEAIYRQFLQIEPDDAQAWNSLGVACLRQDKANLAREYFEKALTLDTHLSSARLQMGLLLRDEGDTREAAAHFRELLEHTPGSAEAASAAMELAWILSTHPDADVRDPDLALKLAERICEAHQYRSARALEALAAAHAAAGQFDQAQVAAEKLLQLAREQDSPQLIARVEAHIVRFREGLLVEP